MRGVVVLPGVELGPGTQMRFRHDFHLLRMWLIYWDQMANPTQNSFHVGLPGEYDLLEKEGIFANYPIDHQGGEGTRIFQETRLGLFNELEKRNPGSWAIFSTPESSDGPQTGEGRALRVHLMSALPVPDIDVPLEDILAFREKRSAERVALMSYIDDVYQSVLNSPDRPLAEHNAIGRLAAGARDQIDAVHDAKMRFSLMDLAADFNLVAGFATAISSLSLGATWPRALGNSLVAGGSITIGKLAGIHNPKTSDTPFRYVGSYHKEVFGL